MSKNKRSVAVLGAGSWGTALAHHLSRAGHTVRLWGRNPNDLLEIQTHHKNPRYLTGVSLSSELLIESDLKAALEKCDVVVVAVPAGAVRGLAPEIAQHAASALIVSTSKGLEDGTLKTMSVVLGEELGASARIAVLSGPTFALELAQGKPTAVTVAAREVSVAEEAAAVFHFDNLRVYTSQDVTGVELGGVVKNVIAIAAGVVDGIGAGANSRAAMITRGLSEMQRLVQAMGGDPITVSGLSGLGDLLLTATGDLSRNRQVGLRLARGEKLPDILNALGQVAEGVRSTEHILALAEQLKVSVPITEEVARLLRGEHSVQESINAILSRSRVSEVLR